MGTLAIGFSIPEGYIPGMGRNPGEERGRSHLYKVMEKGDDTHLLPMCAYGWNRSDGERLSILRGWVGNKGICKTCMSRARLNCAPVEGRAGHHKTKWL